MEFWALLQHCALAGRCQRGECGPMRRRILSEPGTAPEVESVARPFGRNATAFWVESVRGVCAKTPGQQLFSARCSCTALPPVRAEKSVQRRRARNTRQPRQRARNYHVLIPSHGRPPSGHGGTHGRDAEYGKERVLRQDGIPYRDCRGDLTLVGFSYSGGASGSNGEVGR